MTEYELEVQEGPAPGVVVVEAAGELDLTNAAEFEQRLESASTGAAVVVLDLDHVSFIDSAALHVLFRVAARLGGERFGLVLDSGATIARTLQIVGLGEVVRIRRTSTELLEEFRAS